MDRYGAAAMFDFGGEVTSVVPYGNGHINDTYAVTCSLAGGSVRFILQRLNPVVFPDRAGLMRNMIAVTGFLRTAVIRDGGDPERECLRLIPLKDGSPYLTDESVKMFESAGVMTRKELEARNEVKWETYTKKIQIEARVLGDLALNHIVPVATKYQSSLIDNVYKMHEIFPAEKADALTLRNVELIEAIASHTAFIKEHVDAMVEARKVANRITDEREKAVAYHDTVFPCLDEIRYHIDKLELIVDDRMWTLPKYRELLFIR